MTKDEQIERLKKEIHLYKRDGEIHFGAVLKFQQKLDAELKRYERIRRNALVSSPYCAVIMDLEEQIRIRDHVIGELLYGCKK